MGHSTPGSSVHGILQARILEWVSVPFSRGSSWPRDRTCVSYVYLHWQTRSLPLVPPKKPVIECKKILLGILQRWPWTSFSQALLCGQGSLFCPRRLYHPQRSRDSLPGGRAGSEHRTLDRGNESGAVNWCHLFKQRTLLAQWWPLSLPHQPLGFMKCWRNKSYNM